MGMDKAALHTIIDSDAVAEPNPPSVDAVDAASLPVVVAATRPRGKPTLMRRRPVDSSVSHAGQVARTGSSSVPHDAPPAALRVQSIKKRFRKVEAIRDVSFHLNVGERLALLGPNGAGKTTLIRCLAGRTKPDSGTIDLLGKPLPPSGGRDQIGLVPQDIAIYGDLTTRENLVAFARFHRLRGADLQRRVDWALEWTGLENRQNELVGGFSGGMKRRVNLACGVMHSPSVLLLDEPTVGVDPQSRQRIFEMLDQLRDSGTSILLTTHHLDEAEQRCDRIVIIDHGRVIADGTLSELIQSTIGAARHVRLRIDRPLESPIMPWYVGPIHASLGEDTRVDECCLQTRVSDVAGQLPGLLQGVSGAGYSILNVEVHSPSLHDVFLHLTGQALRD